LSHIVAALIAFGTSAGSDSNAEAVKYIQEKGSKGIGILSLVIPPLLVALVPAAITAAVKLAAGRSRSRRSVELTERISILSKSIADLPELPPSATQLVMTPTAALTAELNLVIRELNALQTRESHILRDLSSNATARLRGALLLYRPKGALAFTLHALFFVYSAAAVAVTIVIISIVNRKDAGDLAAFMIFVTLVSVPSLILRRYAARIHQKQCKEALPIPAQHPEPISSPVAVSQQVQA
jgi:hypothetical protein